MHGAGQLLYRLARSQKTSENLFDEWAARTIELREAAEKLGDRAQVVAGQQILYNITVWLVDMTGDTNGGQ